MAKFNDTEFGLSVLSPAFAASKVLGGDADIGDLGVMGAIKRFSGGDKKSDGTPLTEDEKQKVRNMLAAQGKPVPPGMKRGGMVKKPKMKKMASGGSVKSSCQRGDGAAIKGKTRGKMV